MKKVTVILAVVALMISTHLFAQDPPRKTDKKGSSDYTGISRYKGAVIQEYNVINYGEFYLGLDKPGFVNFKGHGLFFKKYLDVKGKINNIQYLIPEQVGISKVYENYKNALTLAGYNIIYTENESEYNNFYSDDYYSAFAHFPDGAYSINTDHYYYLVAKGVKDSLDVYVNLYIAKGSNYGQTFVVVNQSVIETVPLELGLVKADNIAQNINVAGHSIFYDIHFNSGSATINANSDNQIKQIAEYLNNHKDKKFYIVGHTDNVGNFASNMTLSENRAKAVMNELVSKYNVDANQLKAYGVANLSPVTSNKTDGGKARNRRVEIVEQ